MSHSQDKRTPALVHPLKCEVKMRTGLPALRGHALSVQIYAHLCTHPLCLLPQLQSHLSIFFKLSGVCQIAHDLRVTLKIY